MSADNILNWIIRQTSLCGTDSVLFLHVVRVPRSNSTTTYIYIAINVFYLKPLSVTVNLDWRVQRVHRRNYFHLKRHLQESLRINPSRPQKHPLNFLLILLLCALALQLKSYSPVEIPLHVSNRKYTLKLYY